MRSTILRNFTRGLLPAGLIIFLCAFTTTTTDPNQAEVVTTDVAHFWQAFDHVAKAPPAQRVEIYRKEYFDRASHGLKDFDQQRHVTPESLAAYVEQHRAEYERLRPYINEVVDQKPVIQAAFRKLAALYPGIKLPRHVYFVVGQQHGAGMNSPHGIILAADVFATPPGTPYDYTKVTPAYVPFSAVHETIHFNQAYETGDKSTLLQQVINEGTADFIASLVIRAPSPRAGVLALRSVTNSTPHIMPSPRTSPTAGRSRNSSSPASRRRPIAAARSTSPSLSMIPRLASPTAQHTGWPE